jgi:large subunit ribosomal protein L33
MPPREPIFLECTECQTRYYRTTKSTKNQAAKLELKKFCPQCRKRVPHKEKKK